MTDLTAVTVSYSPHVGVQSECHLYVAGSTPGATAGLVEIEAGGEPNWFVVGDADFAYIKVGHHWVVAS